MRNWYKLPWAEYLADQGLMLASLPAQGLYWRLLAMAVLSPRPGYVLICGKTAVTINDIARLCQTTAPRAQRLLKQLQERHLLCQNSKGIWYLPRIVQAWQQWQIYVQAGKKGGNPALFPAGSKQEENNVRYSRKTFGSTNAQYTSTQYTNIDKTNSLGQRRRSAMFTAVSERLASLDAGDPADPVHRK